ncbi:MAG: hypothetical protein QM802_23415 [Agriterribacter sp.]
MNLKKLLPMEKYVLSTQLSAEEIRQRVADNIEPEDNSFFVYYTRIPQKMYEGEITNNDFSMRRITVDPDLSPSISGHIKSYNGHTEVNIGIGPDTWTIIFACAWLAMMIYASISQHFLLAPNFQDAIKNGLLSRVAILFTGFVLMYILVIFSFRKESRKSKKFLADLFEGREI